MPPQIPLGLGGTSRWLRRRAPYTAVRHVNRHGAKILARATAEGGPGGRRPDAPSRLVRPPGAAVYSRGVAASSDQNRIDHPLRTTARPAFEAGHDRLRIVDLFAGCGGLTLGAAQAAREAGAGLDVVLALDQDETAVDVYRHNFPKADARVGSVERHFDGDLGAPRTAVERRTAEACGEVGLLVGGPPCQGHSDLNNHTRRQDPKNALYARMARAAAVLRPAAVMIENVPAVLHDKGKTVDVTRSELERLGYRVADDVVHLQPLGVAQTRKRHVLLAVGAGAIQPRQVLDDLAGLPEDPLVDLAWAIGDLASISEPKGYDKPPKASAQNLERMRHLLDNDQYDLPNDRRPPCHQDGAHSYLSMYGRLRWDRPAQTITSGFSSIGQGRYMHPSLARALTGHEAARIQGFPDYFRFDKATRRGDLATIVGNAVPPPLTFAIVRVLLPALLTRPPCDCRSVAVPVPPPAVRRERAVPSPA